MPEILTSPDPWAQCQSMSPSLQSNRSIRVFLSSTLRDMKEEREALVSHTWSALRQFCREREVEFVEGPAIDSMGLESALP
jgi:hypothetical protein